MAARGKRRLGSAPGGRRLAGALVSALLLSGTSAARCQLLGPEFPINATTEVELEAPAVATTAAGTFVVVWQSPAAYPALSNVTGRRFDPAGQPLGGEFLVNSHTTDLQRQPAVAADAAGGFVVVWQSYAQDDPSWGVFGQRFDPSGLPIGNEFRVNSYTTGNQFEPAVAADAAGNFVVTWTSDSQDGSDYGIFGQRFAAAGDPQGAEFLVNMVTGYSQHQSDVAMNAAGAFVVVWQSYAKDGEEDGVFLQRYDSSGAPLGVEFQVNSHTPSTQGSAAVTFGGAGGFVVVWESRGTAQDGSETGIVGQRFDAGGNWAGVEFQVNSYTTGYQVHPQVATDSMGNFVVVWESRGQDGSLGGIFGQRFSLQGARLGGEFAINATTTYDQAAPAVAIDDAGNGILVWESEVVGGFYRDLSGRRLAGVLFADGFETADACAWSSILGGSCP